MSIIEVNNLSKVFRINKKKPGLLGAFQGLFNREYELKTAVDNISFQVQTGEIVGYIGPNGAGKSTTIKMLVGILVPSGGDIIVNGYIPYKNRIENTRKIGVVFGQRSQLWWDIPVIESLTLMKYMYRIPEKQFLSNLDMFSDILGLSTFINMPVRQLSLGQRMRADLCAALLHNPDILYLDEPTIGLDVVVKEDIRQFIKEINKSRKTTIILTTHDMADIEKLCSRVIVIDKGVIRYDGEIAHLKNTYGMQEILTADLEESIIDESVFNNLGVNEAKVESNKVTLKYNRTSINSTQILSWLINNFRVRDFTVRETEIDEIIRNIYTNHF